MTFNSVREMPAILQRCAGPRPAHATRLSLTAVRLHATRLHIPDLRSRTEVFDLRRRRRPAAARRRRVCRVYGARPLRVQLLQLLLLLLLRRCRRHTARRCRLRAA